ncbi:hypothetical protein HYH03_001794 [Edaphochlamys debaryana]|uniref:Pex N-terminal domain-containing protein n=1 Tax=Edaphochlamys debaryana TaxID=47281 RepID=A0A836C4J2_9CHLO|nr:hypothetical protein HYH03_001794 [Edaphochlamys debaryana]|eukprot:KAG2500216.1 hypothetical protein HYH03_001794 [Edaphochlamys debaryana]
MFVNLGGDENSVPTYFEVVAADRLVPSLKAAVVYALSVFSQRHPWVHRLLAYDDELFALFTLALDGHSLLSGYDSTFADSLYGLKRRALGPRQAAGPRGPGIPPPPAERLSSRQRWYVLIATVLLPYVRAKLDKTYRACAAATGAAQPGGGVLGLALRYSGGGGAPAEGADERGGGSATPPAPAPRERLQRAFVAAYPWMHAGMEGLTFAYHLSYLLGASAVHHPVLHALGLSMARTSGADMMAMDKAKQTRRQALLTSLLPPPSAAAALAAAAAGGSLAARAAAVAARLRAGAVRGVLGVRWAVEDHARSALILAVFGFKALEWWYTTAEASLARGKALPVPPPPPPPRPAPPPLGVGLPADPSDCPVCRKRTVNPAAIATSGYVACYPCAFAYVMEHGACPVSGLPAGLDHVRRLYEAA